MKNFHRKNNDHVRKDRSVRSKTTSLFFHGMKKNPCHIYMPYIVCYVERSRVAWFRFRWWFMDAHIVQVKLICRLLSLNMSVYTNVILTNNRQPKKNTDSHTDTNKTKFMCSHHYLLVYLFWKFIFSLLFRWSAAIRIVATHKYTDLENYLHTYVELKNLQIFICIRAQIGVCVFVVDSAKHLINTSFSFNNAKIVMVLRDHFYCPLSVGCHHHIFCWTTIWLMQIHINFSFYFSFKNSFTLTRWKLQPISVWPQNFISCFFSLPFFVKKKIMNGR